MADSIQNNEMGWNLENSYSNLPETFYMNVNPSPVSSPVLVVLNDSLATSIGLKALKLQTNEGLNILAGNKVPQGSKSIAQAYAGHQFGYFTMLGDGRAMLLGEQITPKGERFDIQLKGSGVTPYSRQGDGRAALGPMLREYIMSEAMHALGIATTRSLAVVKTGEPVFRETVQEGAVLTRIAMSHLRVGTFQYAHKWGKAGELKTLADYTIQRHFPEVDTTSGNRYLSLLQEVVKRQALLIAKWQLVGFIHGVMNTDNMALSGETIDYGPCAFLDVYHPETVFSSIDRNGRYAYGNQPNMAAWNLSQFAESLLPLLDENQDQAIKLAQKEILNFTNLYRLHWLSGMRGKLGIFNEESEDETLIDNLLSIMQKYRADYTNTFCALSFENLEDSVMFDSPEFKEWYKIWLERLGRQPQFNSDAQDLMQNNNPAIIPRNHRVEEALEAAVKQGDYSVMKRLLMVLSKPYAHLPEQMEYATLPEASSRPYRTFCGT